MKQHTTPRSIRTIFDWTPAFIHFIVVYLQRHPRKALEMLRYMDIVRLAYTKWGGMGWLAYDEQFRALVAVYPKCWSIIDHNLWSLCVTAPQTI